MSIETEHLVLHPLTPAEARRIISRTPGPDDTWADGFPREDDLEALLAGSNRLWSAGAHQRDNF